MLIEGDWCSGSADFNLLAADLNILTRDQTLMEFLDGQTPSGSTPLLIATARRMLAFSGDFTPVLAMLANKHPDDWQASDLADPADQIESRAQSRTRTATDPTTTFPELCIALI